MIAVRVKDRPPVAVLADMIDGVMEANRLVGQEAAERRDTLWSAVADLAAVEVEDETIAAPNPRGLGLQFVGRAA